MANANLRPFGLVNRMAKDKLKHLLGSSVAMNQTLLDEEESSITS